MSQRFLTRLLASACFALLLLTLSMQPTKAAVRHPILFVHGWNSSASTWNTMVGRFKQDGWTDNQLYTWSYSSNQTNAQIAQEIQSRVASILASTGATKVDIISHSMGGLSSRYYLKNLGGAAVVDDLVGLAPSNHGTTSPLAPIAFGCPACRQQAAGSAFLRELNSGDESPGGVSYTHVVTRYDEVVIPYTSGYLAPDNAVTNVTLQSKCPNDTTEHLRIIYDSVALQIAMNALARSGPASGSFQPACF